MIANLVNGEPIPSIQQCIVDTCLCDFVVISMSSDTVFLRCMGEENVLYVFNEAKDFLVLFQSLYVWNSNPNCYERHAWLCLYCVLVHAWNEKFFKLCVSVCMLF